MKLKFGILSLVAATALALTAQTADAGPRRFRNNFSYPVRSWYGGNWGGYRSYYGGSPYYGYRNYGYSSPWYGGYGGYGYGYQPGLSLSFGPGGLRIGTGYSPWSSGYGGLGYGPYWRW